MPILVFSPNGTYTTKTSLATAATAADAAGKTIHVTSPQVVTTAIVWPSDRELVFDKGGYVTFTGAGALTGLKEARPEWFGNNVTPGITPMAAAFLAAANSSQSVIADAQYSIESAVTLPLGVNLYGLGMLIQPISAIANNILITTGNNKIHSLTIKGSVTTGNTDYGDSSAIRVVGSDVTVHNCDISGKQNGIYSENGDYGDNVTIEGNKIRYSKRGITLVTATDPAPNRKKNTRVVGNNVALQEGFNPSVSSDMNIRGIIVWGSSGAHITGNTSVGAPLSMEFWWDDSSTISDNVSDIWVSFSGTSDTDFKNNTINYALLPVIHASIPTIYTAAMGLELVACKNMLVSGNHILNQPGSGIWTGYVGGTPSPIASNLTIVANHIQNCASSILSSAYAGMSLGYLNNSLISDNHIVDCGSSVAGYSIVVGGYHEAMSLDVDLKNNYIIGNKNATTTVYGGAVNIRGAKNINFSENTILNSAGHGLSVGGDFTYGVVISKNRSNGNAARGIYLGDNINEISIFDNELLGNASALASTAGPFQPYAKYRNNTGFVQDGSTPVLGTYSAGEIFNISHATNKWLRCTTSGTFGTITGAAISTVNGSSAVTLNALAAKYLVNGQYITISGAVAGAVVIWNIVHNRDANGYIISATANILALATATVTNGATAYSNPTVVQVL